VRGRKERNRVSLFCLGQASRRQQQTPHPHWQTLWLRMLFSLLFPLAIGIVTRMGQATIGLVRR
jgi:hypothetical protein